VCIGDSLTSGLLPDRGYPAQLQELIQLPVINLGQSGITTEGALERLSKVAGVVPPAQVVIIELGGHDFLKGLTRAATKRNLEQLVDACRALGAEVVLIEIPRGFMTDPFWGLERQIAHEKDVELVADSAIRQLVLWSPISPPGMWAPGSHLSDDGIHSNLRGSENFARHVANALERMYPGIKE
jgi:lysophospholipase L1-like esterase